VSGTAVTLRRTVVTGMGAMGAALALAGATAFACITPATLNLSSAAGRPGDVITVTGQSWKPDSSVATPVRLHWHSTQGQVLGEAIPDDATITIPDGPPGFYAITGVLRNEQGADAPGTPSRALFEIRNPTAAPPPEPLRGTFTPTAEPQGSSFPLALVMGLGAVGLVLFASGFIAVTRGRRTEAATPARVRRD
jgi:hypothetical protein